MTSKILMLLFIMIIAIATPNVIAQGCDPTPEELAAQEAARQAQERADALFNCFSTHCQNTGIPFNSNEIRGLCNEIGTENTSNAPLEALTSFCNATAPIVNTTEGLIDAVPNRGNCNSTLNSACSELNKGFMEDLAAGQTFPINDYVGDFNQIQNEIQSDLACLNPSQGNNRTNTDNGQDPKFVKKYTDAQFVNKFLDKGMPAVERNNLKLEVQSFGVSNRFQGLSIIDIIRRFQGKFGAGADGELLNITNFFMDSWQGVDSLVQQSATDEQGDRLNSFDFTQLSAQGGNSVAQIGSNFNLDGDGILVPPGSENTLVNDFGEPTSGSNQEEGRFNNRSFGYQYSNGPMTTFVLTVGGEKYELHDFVFTSPIILDMDGDSRFEASNGECEPHGFKGARVVEFDMNGDHFVDLVEWVGPTDGLLMTYTPGQEVSGNNLFGEAGGFFDGYEKLSVMDRNADGQISGEELATLSVWQDRNGNAKVEEGEVSSVTALGITSIATTHSNYTSSFVQNGATKAACDWYPCMFRVKRTK